jgi:hypothetical protein
MRVTVFADAVAVVAAVSARAGAGTAADVIYCAHVVLVLFEMMATAY